MQKNEFEPLPHIIYKINSKLIKDQNVRAKGIKLLEESIGVTLCDLGVGSVFLDMNDIKSTGNQRKSR